MNAQKLVVALVALCSGVSAWAGAPPVPVPEPESLALVALAGVIGYLVKRRKK